MNPDIYIPREVFNSATYKELVSSSKVLLLRLWICCSEWGDCEKWQLTIKQEEMAIHAGMSLKTVVKAVRELTEANLIWTCAGSRSSYGLATAPDSYRPDSLTVGQRRLIELVRPTSRHPRTANTRQGLLRISELKRQLMMADCRCYVCGVLTALELHHLTYERYGHERLEDCILLCERCHLEVTKL